MRIWQQVAAFEEAHLRHTSQLPSCEATSIRHTNGGMHGFPLSEMCVCAMYGVWSLSYKAPL